MSETTEREAINRFIEGTRAAADYMLMLQNIDKFPRASKQFMTAIRDASGSAHQLAHMQQNPVFFDIRDQLESIMKKTAQLAFANHIGKKPPAVNGQSVFVRLSDMLKALSILGKKISSSRAMKRTDVLFAIDQREKIVKADINANASS